MKTPCKHGSILPYGLKCQAGYLVIRLKTELGPFNKGCGPHTPAMEKVARLALEDIRVKQKLGQFNIPTKAERMKFRDASMLFHRKHYVEFRNPETHEPRSLGSINIAMSMIKTLIEYFGESYIDAITTRSINDYKTYRIEHEGVSNATFNKEKGVLSSVFNMFAQWKANGDISSVKLPVENPAKFVPDLREIPRTRVFDLEELKRIKQACIVFKDEILWTAIRASIETNLRRSDLLKASYQIGRVIQVKQGKTGKDIRLPGNPLLESLRDCFKNPRALEWRWRRVVDRANVDNAQWRDLRRTGAKLAEKLGATRRQIKNALGHASEDMTEVYLPSDPEELREISRKKHEVLESL